MGAADLTAGQVMDGAASLMNDTAKTSYNYIVQIPYLRIALQELREYYELHHIPVTQKVSAVITIPSGTTSIIYNAVAPAPALPTDFVGPLQLWEREVGIDPFIPMHRRDFLPHALEGVQIGQFIYFVWNSQEIQFLPAIRDNEIKMDYLGELFPSIVDNTSLINVVNATTFLEYRTAALLCEFIERNLTSANALNVYAGGALDRATGINVKGKQSIVTRRRPFRASYKKRGWVT